MAWQLCCCGMCKNLLRSDGQQRNYCKANFPSNLNWGQKIISETGPWASFQKILATLTAITDGSWSGRSDKSICMSLWNFAYIYISTTAMSIYMLISKTVQNMKFCRFHFGQHLIDKLIFIYQYCLSWKCLNQIYFLASNMKNNNFFAE